MFTQMSWFSFALLYNIKYLHRKLLSVIPVFSFSFINYIIEFYLITLFYFCTYLIKIISILFFDIHFTEIYIATKFWMNKVIIIDKFNRQKATVNFISSLSLFCFFINYFLYMIMRKSAILISFCKYRKCFQYFPFYALRSSLKKYVICFYFRFCK